MNEQKLMEALGRLPRERQPRTDLWPGIEARIGSGRPARAWWLSAVAAAVVAGFALVFGVSVREPGGPEPMVRQAAGSPGMGLVYASGVDLEYSGVLRDLTGQMRTWSTNGTAQQSLHQSLQVLTEAAEELRAAIEADPGSVYLARLLETTQRKQLDVMRELLMQRQPGDESGVEQRRT